MLLLALLTMYATLLLAAPLNGADHAADCGVAPPAKAEMTSEGTTVLTAESLLAELEDSAAALIAFTADVYYENYEDLLGRREIRIGELIYRIDRDADATNFAVLFDRLIIGQRLQTRLKHYVFSERWLAEIDHEAKQFIKRELVPPGRRIDPLKLGEGPIPLPIGQRKDDVLRRFEVSLHELPEDGPLAQLENVDGLLLIPHPGTPEADTYQRVELYYDRETRLPVGINAIETNDNRKTVRLSNVVLNPDLTDEQRAKLSIEQPDPRTWAIDIRPYQGG